MNSDLIAKISEYGLLGLLLTGSLFAIFYLYKETKKERNGRLEDLKTIWSEDMEFRKELKILIQTILDILRSTK